MIFIELIHCKILFLCSNFHSIRIYFLSLQLPLKRFRGDDQLNRNGIESAITTSEPVYLHGQPTPPSPSQSLIRV
jgi:hypothetical protein